jgi:hypothetical protein
MQLISSVRCAGPLASAVVVLMALAACSDGKAGSAGSATASPVAADGGASYQLVTQVRPENPGKAFPLERAAYEVCADAARAKNLPVKPLPQLPADFVTTRTTYASDGKQRLFREVKYKLSMANSGPENGCQMRVVSASSSELARSGKARIAEVNEEGALVVTDNRPADTEPVSQSKLAGYTLAKVINGVPLKCKAEACIVDPAQTVIALGKRPVIAADRLDEVRSFGTVLVTEPVSLSVGKPIDPAVFVQEKSK